MALGAGFADPFNRTQMDAIDLKFMEFVNEHGRSYGTMEEFNFRSSLFRKNVQELEEINADSENTFTVAVNHLSDRTEDEKKQLNGY